MTSRRSSFETKSYRTMAVAVLLTSISCLKLEGVSALNQTTRAKDNLWSVKVVGVRRLPLQKEMTSHTSTPTRREPSGRYQGNGEMPEFHLGTSGTKRHVARNDTDEWATVAVARLSRKIFSLSSWRGRFSARWKTCLDDLDTSDSLRRNFTSLDER